MINNSIQEPSLGIFIQNQEQFDSQKQGTRIQFNCVQCGCLCSIKVSPSVPARAKQRRLLCKTCGCRLTCIETYGVDNPNKSENIRNKIKETCMKRYGVEHPGQADITKQHIKESNLRKYGVECSFQSEIVKNKIKETLIERYGVEYAQQSKQIQETTKRNNLAKYGTESVMRVYGFKTKQKQACMEKYGVENVFQADWCKEKLKETNLKKYGVCYPMQSDDVQLKSRQSCIERYGVPYSSMNKSVMQKIISSKYERYGTCSVRCLYEYDNEKFDSSWELAFYVYNRDNGATITRCPYSILYYYNGVEHHYEPDFEVDGQLYEIKGDHFLRKGSLTNPFNDNKNDLANAKYECCIAHNVIFISEKEIQPYLDYVNQKYGKDFLKSCKIQKVQD